MMIIHDCRNAVNKEIDYKIGRQLKREEGVYLEKINKQTISQG